MSFLAIVLILAGLFFLIVAATGMLRLPDVFARSHALSIADSLGAFLVLAGLAIYQGISIDLLRILSVLVLIFALNPVIAHATIRAALRSGLKPWEKNLP